MIDDEPDGPNDPQFYIILIGFREALLASALIDLKININAVINLKTEYNAKLECVLSTESTEAQVRFYFIYFIFEFIILQYLCNYIHHKFKPSFFK